MKILTFNHHESYLCSLAHTGHEFDVVTEYKQISMPWKQNCRPAPSNMKLITFDEGVHKKIENGHYDLIICHTIESLTWMSKYKKTAFLFIAHVALYDFTWQLRLKALFKKLYYHYFAATHKSHFVAVSRFKRSTWSIPAPITNLYAEDVPLVDHSKEVGPVAVVGNNLPTRAEMKFSVVAELSSSFPMICIGNNPGISYGYQPKDFDDFIAKMSQSRIYLYNVKQPYGDGFNTSLLEAMKMGMAIVTIDNPSSPIEHGKNGLIGKDSAELKKHLNFLFANPEEVTKFGEAARKTIAEQFNLNRFTECWNTAINDATGQAKGSKTPFFSILVPCYNSQAFVTRLSESIIKQSYKDFECIFIDDGSTDETLSVLEKICKQDKRLKFMSIAHTGLPAQARNIAAKNAQGQYLIFWDADDLCHHQLLEAHFNAFQENPKVKVSTFSKAKVFYNEIPKADEAPIKIPKPKIGYCYPNLGSKNSIITTGTAIAKSTFDLLGGFDTSKELSIGEDYLLWIQAAEQSEFARHNLPWIYRLEHQNNVTKSKPKLIKGLHSIASRMQESDKQFSSAIKAQAYKSEALHHLRAGNIEPVRKLLISSLKNRFRMPTLILLLAAPLLTVWYNNKKNQHTNISP